MKNPTIHILFEFVEGPWGGGNQFLKALKKEFCRNEVYEEDSTKADIILFNNYPFRHEHYFAEIYQLRKMYSKTVIHRVTGPFYLARGSDLLLDKIRNSFNRHFCDGTIFQSEWSVREDRHCGMKHKQDETVILNAPDPNLFFPLQSGKARKRDGKVKIIATSWSANMRKGFALYDFLDRNLDFSRYEMSFFGNSPITFSNIRQFKPVPSEELGARFREHDLYITASINDACSNSLLEAMHCGLPAVVIESGGNPEIVGAAGTTFKNEEDILQALDTVAGDIPRYRKLITLPSITEVANKYYDFCVKVHEETPRKVKQARKRNLLWIKGLIWLHQAKWPIGASRKRRP